MSTRQVNARKPAKDYDDIVIGAFFLIAVACFVILVVWWAVKFLFITDFNPLTSQADRLWGVRHGHVDCPVVGYDGPARVYDCSGNIPRAAQQAWESWVFWQKVVTTVVTTTVVGLITYNLGRRSGKRSK